MALDVRALLTLSTIPGIGPNRLRAIVSHFDDPAAVGRASARQLAAVEGIEKKLALSIVTFFRNAGPDRARRFVDEQLSRLNRVDGRLVTFWEKEYPASLKKIYDPPPFLFVRGHFTDDDAYAIAVVGTRSPSSYGTQMTERFTAGLAELGLPVVSGLARGVDTAAHNAALAAGGRTIAILGSGVDVIYPPENRQLGERIIAQGALASEFVMGTKPDAGNFPRRNRIISGIAIATVVIETGVEGGAMITATTACDQNRDVFAIPSAVSDKRRSGTNLLIKEGRAMLTERVEDIITELGPRLKHILPTRKELKREPPPDLTVFEQHLYDAMGDEPVHIDTLAEHAHISISDALVQLLSLEFKGAVRQMPGKMFVRM
jgi:DNA processing protein